MTTEKKHVIEFSSQGESGYIYAILARIYELYQELGRGSEYADLRARVYGCHIYEDQLAVIREAVDLVDLDGKY